METEGILILVAITLISLSSVYGVVVGRKIAFALEKLHDLLNSRISELIVAETSSALLKGRAEGRETEKGDERARRQRSIEDNETGPLS